jgi:hypothetical protein
MLQHNRIAGPSAHYRTPVTVITLVRLREEGADAPSPTTLTNPNDSVQMLGPTSYAGRDAQRRSVSTHVNSRGTTTHVHYWVDVACFDGGNLDRHRLN